MHDPSAEAEIALSFKELISIDQTLDRCSFKEASIDWLCFPNFQILISPFIPPVTNLVEHLVEAIAVTPLT